MLAIGILGLILTGLILWTQHQNAIERRHGEIVQLKAQLLSRMSSLRQRDASNMISCQTIRLELRRIPDSDDKFDAIENLPGLLNDMKALMASHDKFIELIDKIDTLKMNRANTLLYLQSLVANDLEKLERNQRVIDDNFITLLSNVRAGLKDQPAN